MNVSTLKLAIQEHIAHLQFKRPAAYNTLNKAFWQEFPQAIQSIHQAEDVRVLVISSTGKHFSAGLDLDFFTQPDPRLFSGEGSRRAEFVYRLVLELQACFNQLEQLRIPVLAAIQGACIGGALDLICACDCRYASEEAFFCVKETQMGMVADLGTLQRLPRLISPGLARELVYTSRNMPASEAQAAGLVNQLFPDTNSLLEGVMDIAKQIATQSPVAVMGSKNILNHARDHSITDSLTYTAAWQAGMLQPADLMESMVAKTQKRDPAYKPLHPATASWTHKP
ncbi:MAG: enoyl-CoA hydratase [Proteobacteria bacterium]|nr:MAG: enoyl-CoA hydratase [Pseudomonadota bacterium]